MQERSIYTSIHISLYTFTHLSICWFDDLRIDSNGVQPHTKMGVNKRAVIERSVCGWAVCMFLVLSIPHAVFKKSRGGHVPCKRIHGNGREDGPEKDCGHNKWPNYSMIYNWKQMLMMTVSRYECQHGVTKCHLWHVTLTSH